MPMSDLDKSVKEKMRQALDKYKQDKNSVQEFYPCTKKLSTWLQEKTK